MRFKYPNVVDVALAASVPICLGLARIVKETHSLLQ